MVVAPRIQTSPYWVDSPSPAQWTALSLTEVPELLYGGAAGGGKSSYQLQAASQFVHDKDWHALLIRKQLTDLTLPGALLDRALSWWGDAKGVSYLASKRRFTFPSGATITFGYLDDDLAHQRYQGAEFSFIGVDEAGEIPIHQLDYLTSRLRLKKNSDLTTQYRLTSNPFGPSKQWLFDNFVSAARPDTTHRKFLPARLYDNPGINQEQYAQTLDRLTPVLRAQLLEGDWSVEEEGGVFQPSQWQILAKKPDDDFFSLKVRYWDMAATPVTEQNRDPDWAVGSLLGLGRDGIVYLLDIERFREGPARLLERMKSIAWRDGSDTHIVIEEEPGSSGKTATFLYVTELADYYVQGDRPTGPKAARARRTATALKDGVLQIFNGPWLTAMRSEFSLYTGEDRKGFHDDQVDSVSGGLSYLVGDDRIYVAVV